MRGPIHTSQTHVRVRPERVGGAPSGDLSTRQSSNAALEIEAAGGTLAARRLKVLLICHWFPPLNVIGAVRVGHFAKRLHEAGHDVRVLTADAPGNQSLPLAIPANCVTYIAAPRGGERLYALTRLFRRSIGKPAGRGLEANQGVSAAPSTTWLAAALRKHYYALLQIPDVRAPWMRRATAAGCRIVKQWNPDIIIASAPPNSGLIAASRIARACDAPWIAELRDLWTDNPYYEHPRWRLWLDRQIERAILGTAAGLITVSPIWADTLRQVYRQPTACIPNGFVEEDFPAEPPVPAPGNVVSIIYTGNIYAGYRDPTPLFRAIGLLGPEERQHVAVRFYGPSEEDARGVAAAAAAEGVNDRVSIHERVSYRTSLSLQSSADVLLLLQWNNAKDAGNIPAKFFEYLGARRPILCIGYESGNLAQMIRDREAGLVANDPLIIARQLRSWIAQRPSAIPAVGPKAREGMTRDAQYQKLEQFLATVLHCRSISSARRKVQAREQ